VSSSERTNGTDAPERFRICRGLAVQHESSDYRTMGALCLEIASRMSLESERARLTDVAREWFELAEKAEAERSPDGCRSCGDEAKRDEALGSPRSTSEPQCEGSLTS
jgi:hypothetical protein